MSGKTKKLLKSSLSLLLVIAMVLTALPAKSAKAEPGVDPEPNILVQLTFDGADVLDAGTNAKATGTYATIDRDGGKAVSLSGTQFISLTKADDSSLLTGLEEFMISFDINNQRTDPVNWAFYAAPNDNAPGFNSENYLGILFNGGLSVERYYQGRNSTGSSTVAAQNIGTGSWRHIDVVVRENGTIVLVDGVFANATNSTSRISSILGNNSIFQIGKANWGSGEYSEAYIDNFTIYDGITTAASDQIVANAKSTLTLNGIDALDDNITLPTYYNGASISWSTSDSSVITDEGVITRNDDNDKTATLTATISAGGYGASDTKDFAVTVLKNQEIPFDNYLVASYSFEDNVANQCDASGTDVAVPYAAGFGSYSGNITYENGVIGKAVRTGSYGLSLNKKNLGTDFTVSLWCKPDGTFNENEVLLFLGFNSPERWTAISGNRTGRAAMKIWGNGGTFNTHTTMWTQNVNAGGWHNIVLSGKAGNLTLYYDGNKVGNDYTNSNDPLNGTNQNINLAISHWSADACFRGLIDEVKVYNKTVKADFVAEEYNKNILKAAANSFTLTYTDPLMEDLTLPSSTSNNTSISWSSSDESVITSSGVITRAAVIQSATLTATFTRNGLTETRTFDVNVATNDFSGEVALAKEALSIPSFVAKDITLPSTGLYGTQITWQTSNADILGADGKIGSARPAAGEGPATVTLTATITRETNTDTKTFAVKVMEEPYGYILGYIRGTNDRTGALHIAYSKEGTEFTALNGNAGILFVQIPTSDGTKNLSTGQRFGAIGLYRKDDGSFGVVAPKTNANATTYYTYSSDDLLSFTFDGNVTTSSANYAEISSLYQQSRLASSTGLTVPQGASGMSIMPVTRAEYEKIIKRFDVVTNTGVYFGTTSVTAASDKVLDDVLPKFATATYSDGSEAAINVKWNTDQVNMSKAGTYTLTGSLIPYDNPLAEQRADPQIKYDELRNCYYMTASYPAYNNANNGYNRITLRRADTIQGLADSEGGLDKEITIWNAPSSGNLARHVWAPELHNIQGKWYVFFAAGSSSNVWAIRPYVLVCQNNDDPFNADSWKDSSGQAEIHAATSKVNAYFKNMSLDMTYFEHKGHHYVIWADIIGQSALYMQEIDPDNPWTGISDTVIQLTTPEFGWERDSERVNEGPTIIKHGGKVFCAFSASGTGPEYCIGMLYADEDADLMDKNSWTKMGYPLLTSSDVPGEYGPGHNSFTVDAQGNPVFVYHARSEECYLNQCQWASSDPLYDPCRHARVKNVHWNEEGLPILKMNAEQEIPTSMRSVSIQVTIQNDSVADLANATISGYESGYEVTGSPIKPNITVSYNGSELTAGTDYTVSYGENTEVGQGTITITAASNPDFEGSKTVTFNIYAKPELKVHYEMELSADGKIVNKAGNSAFDATVTGLDADDFASYGNDTKILKFDGNGYITLPANMIDDNTFTFSVIAETTNANNQWLVSIGKNNWNYAFFTPTNSSNNTKFAVAQAAQSSASGAWAAENAIQTSSVGRNGSYHIYTVVVNDNTTALYVDGVKKATGSNSYDITSFFSGINYTGYLGRSMYPEDPLYVGGMADFKLYDNALTDDQVAAVASTFNEEDIIIADLTATMLNGNESLDNVKTNLSFPSSIGGKSITWSIPSGQSVITSGGNVVRPVDGNAAHITITAIWNSGSSSKSFDITVPPITIDTMLEDLTLPYGTAQGKEVYGNITLPQKTGNGVDIVWTASEPSIIDVYAHENAGYDTTPAGTVTRPAADTVVTLTAKITVDGASATKTFDVKVKAAPAEITEDDYTDYFFAYFIGEGTSTGEQVYFATSEDGLNWTELNNGRPSLTSTLGEKGVRDPYIIRSPEGDKFYIIATDLKINGGNGWTAAQNAGSQSLMVWESTDLVHWSNQRMVEVSAAINAGCTWAPEATYDPKTGEYIVYWASKTQSDNYNKQRMYYAKTRDFYTFTEPKVFIDLDQSTIDTTIIEHNGNFYRYSKNEGGSNNSLGANSKKVFVQKSSELLGTYEGILGSNLNSYSGVEGPTIFKLNKDDAATDTWCLLLDNYGSGGYYPVMTNDLDSGQFTRPSTTYKMPNSARHGTPVRITREEYYNVMGIDPNVTPTPVPSTTAAPAADGIDLSGTSPLYGTGTVTYDAATNTVTGTDVNGLLIPLGMKITTGATCEITVYGTATGGGARSWLSDGANQRMSDIQSPMNFQTKYSYTAAQMEDGTDADHFQIKGASYDTIFSSITITKIVVDYDPSKDPTPTPVPTATPTRRPTATPKVTAEPTAKPDETAKPGDGTPVPSNATATPGAATATPPAGSASTPDPNSGAAGEPKVGDTVESTGAMYTILSDTEVEYAAPKSKAITKVIIPAKVKIGSKSYKVTGIAKKAFKGCKKLKTIQVKTKTLKKVGKQAFKGIKKKAKFYFPKKKFKAYRKLFKGKGQKKAKYKKSKK